MKVRYARQASTDLLGIADYVHERNPSAAIDVEAAIRSTVDLLADLPKLGRDRPQLDARSLGVPRYPYTITTPSKASSSGSSIFATIGENRLNLAISEPRGQS